VRYERGGRILALGVVGATVAALLVTPAAWSIRAVFTPITGSIVSGTPGGGMGGPGGGFDRNSSSSGIAQEWLTFIQNNLGGQLMLLGMLAVAGGVLFGLRYLLRNHRFFNRPALAGVLLALFLASSSGWWINVAQAQTTSTGVSRFDGGRMGEQQANQTLVHYLETNQSDYKYLVAVSSSQSAAPIIIETGLPVMSIGGFTGSDKTITSTAQLEQLIANHTVRYFLLGGGGGPGGGSSVVSQYVQQKCTLVDSSQYSSSASSSGTSSATGSSDGRSNGFGAMGGFGGQQQLYVCGG
jgi:hypothetical protein